MELFFVGDSFVHGFGDPACLGWAGRVVRTLWEREIEVTYYNLGIRRNTSEQIRSRWDEEVNRRSSTDRETRIVFSFGTNDTTFDEGQRRVSENQSLRNFENILSGAREVYPTLMIGPPPILDTDQNLRTAELNRQYKKRSDDLNVPYLDIFQTLEDSSTWRDELRGFDGAHPGEQGYQKMADEIGGWDAWQDWFACSQ